MEQAEIAISRLRVNKANDRHGELNSEPAAIAELFRTRDAHMRRLSEDITNEGRIFEPPLVLPQGRNYVVFDGNRRVTCLKLLRSPERAPTQELQRFFQALSDRWIGGPPQRIICMVEEDREIIDSILYRRHTGSQGGVGQSPWDDRAKRNFQDRTGRNERVDIADEVERLLQEADSLPERQIPRSTLNRLLSSEPLRSRLGISVQNGEFRLTHVRDVVIPALARVADDLAERRVVLGDLWDNVGKREYLDRLEGEAILPRAVHAVAEGDRDVRRVARLPQRRRVPLPPRDQTTFIPDPAPVIQWTGDQQRLRFIWEELQHLNVHVFPNAVSALLRMLMELTTDNYISHHGLDDSGGLSQKVRSVADHLCQRAILTQEYRQEIERMRRDSELISIQSMQRYIHSENFAPMPSELIVYWTRLSPYIVGCLNR